MNTKNSNWDNNIAKAMEQLDGQQGIRSRDTSIQLPDWLPYLVCIAFGFILASQFFGERSFHTVNENRTYATGGKVALLMVAEDIESYREQEGNLPEEPTNPLAQLLNMRYEKLEQGRFRISMDHMGSVVTFDERNDQLTMTDL